MCKCAPQLPNFDIPEIPGEDNNGYGPFFARPPLSRIQSLEQQAFKYEYDFLYEYQDPAGEISEFLKYPLLCPFPGVADAEAKKYQHRRFLDPEFDDQYSSPVSIWLLGNLLACPLEVNLLARSFEGLHGSIEPDRWQSDVLDYWYRDGAEKIKWDLAILWSSRPSSQSSYLPKASDGITHNRLGRGDARTI
jgi:hypothetical protein